MLRFPPLLPRASYQRTDHLETFPNLMGSVHSFIGDERGSLLHVKRFTALGFSIADFPIDAHAA